MDHSLHYDDECDDVSAPDANCALMALQLQGRRQQLHGDVNCSGTSDLLASGPACYEGLLAAEVIRMKVLSYSRGAGSMDLIAAGPTDANCSGSTFKKIGQDIIISDAAKCGFSRASFTSLYCSDQDQMILKLTKPSELNVILSRADCPIEAPTALPTIVAPSFGQIFSSQHGSVSECSGTGDLPSSLPACYSGSALVQSLKIKVVSYNSGSGTAYITATGPTAGNCNGIDFQKSGTNLLIPSDTGCGLDSAEFTVTYCSDQNKVVLHLIQPMELSIELLQSSC